MRLGPRIVVLLQAHSTKVRFLMVGGLNTVFGLTVFPALMWWLGPSMHYLVVLTFAQAISIVFAFFTTKILVFRTEGWYIGEFGKFLSFHLANFSVNLVVLPILVELVHIPPVWAQFFFAITVIVTSYFWHSRITFRSGRSDQ